MVYSLSTITYIDTRQSRVSLSSHLQKRVNHAFHPVQQLKMAWLDGFSCLGGSKWKPLLFLIGRSLYDTGDVGGNWPKLKNITEKNEKEIIIIDCQSKWDFFEIKFKIWIKTFYGTRQQWCLWTNHYALIFKYYDIWCLHQSCGFYTRLGRSSSGGFLSCIKIVHRHGNLVLKLIFNWNEMKSSSENIDYSKQSAVTKCKCRYEVWKYFY